MYCGISFEMEKKEQNRAERESGGRIERSATEK
jgi:hypothetical protein